MTVHELLARLASVKKTSKGWEARCPAHEDHKPSLGVAVGRDARILLHCQAGCTFETIVSALGLNVRDLFPTGPEKAKETAKRIVAAYDYTDEAGTLLFQCVRFEPKDFRPRRPDPLKPGEWLWNLQGTRRVLYRLPEVLAAVHASRAVFVVEGEKDSDVLVAAGFVATCNPLGAKKDGSSWLPEYTEALRGAARVVVIADKDETGRGHARAVAGALHGVARSVKLLELPDVDGRPVKDAADHFGAGGTAEGLRALVKTAGEFVPTAEIVAADITGEAAGDNDKGAVADKLVALVGHVPLFCDDEGRAYAEVSRKGGTDVLRIRGARFSEWLAAEYHRRHRGVARRSVIDDARAVIAGEAELRGDVCPVFIRVGAHDGNILLDLCDPSRRVVEISRHGWRIADSSTVKFLRPAKALPLPEPRRDGDFSSLWRVLNVRERDRVLCAGWLLSSLQPKGPFFLANFVGEQGTGKSCACRILRNLVDPSAIPLRRGTTEERSLWVAAANNRVLAFENLSTLPAWLSDALCALSTGGGYSSRQLFTDADEATFSAQRPVLLNGIADVVARPDLAERTLRLELDVIPKSQRRTESELEREFNTLAPQVLGALLDAAAFGLGRADGFKLPELPRMADAAQWIEACLPKLGFQEGDFLHALERHEQETADTSIDGSPVATAVVALMANTPEFEGPAGELLERLATGVTEGKRQRGEWPGNPRALAAALRRMAPSLRKVGVIVKEPRPGDKTRRWALHKQGVAETSPRPPEPPGPMTGAGFLTGDIPGGSGDGGIPSPDGNGPVYGALGCPGGSGDVARTPAARPCDLVEELV